MDRGPLSSSYRVAEALPKDVGRGLARLDPKDMAELGVEIGDVVEIIAKQTTPVRVMPAHAELRGKRIDSDRRHLACECRRQPRRAGDACARRRRKRRARSCWRRRMRRRVPRAGSKAVI